MTACVASCAKGEIVGRPRRAHSGVEDEFDVRSFQRDADRRREAAGAALSNVGPYDLEKIRVILAATDG